MQEKPKVQQTDEGLFEKEEEYRSYYYDDAHGYEDYDAETESEEDTGSETEPGDRKN